MPAPGEVLIRVLAAGVNRPTSAASGPLSSSTRRLGHSLVSKRRNGRRSWTRRPTRGNAAGRWATWCARSSAVAATPISPWPRTTECLPVPRVDARHLRHPKPTPPSGPISFTRADCIAAELLVNTVDRAVSARRRSSWRMPFGATVYQRPARGRSARRASALRRCAPINYHDATSSRRCGILPPAEASTGSWT